MTMLDKCARAIWEKWEDAYPPSDKRPWEQADTFLDGMLTKALCYMLAQTVLEALRDPTPEMVKAGALILQEITEDGSWEGAVSNAADIFTAMIDEALKETAHAEK